MPMPPPPASPEEYHLLISTFLIALSNATPVHQIVLTGFTKESAEHAAEIIRHHNSKVPGNVVFNREVIVIPTGRQIR